MKSIFVFLSASPAHWLPACWGSVNESGKRSSLYYCRQPAQPHSFPSLLQAREDPHCSPADGHTSLCQLRDGGRAHHALFQSQCTGCLHRTLAWDTKFAGALRLPVPDVSGSLTLPLAPMPVQTTLSNDSTGWWEEFVSEVCCNPPTSISYPRKQCHTTVVMASLGSFESISSVSARLPWAFASQHLLPFYLLLLVVINLVSPLNCSLNFGTVVTCFDCKSNRRLCQLGLRQRNWYCWAHQ